MHLACVDKFISHCSAVTEEVRAREAAVVTSKKRLKRKRQQDQTALNEAAAARKAEHADRLKEKITRGILVLKDGKHIPQRLRKGAFGTGDALNWAWLDEAIVDFWCLHGFALHLLDNKKWRSIIDLSRKTSAAYRPPSSRNDGRSASFETILEDRQQVTNELVDAELAKIEVCGATIVSDAATVHRRPVSNFMLKAAVHQTPLMLDLVDSTTALQNGHTRDAEWYTEKTVDLIRSTPKAGRCIVLQVGDTVAEQLAMFELVEAACPWVSSQLGVCHGTNRILTIVGAIPRIGAILIEVLEVVDWFMNHKLQHAVFEKHSKGRALVTPCDSRYGFNFIAMLKLLKEVETCQKAVGDPAYIEAGFDNDIIKPRVNDTGWWNRVADICEFVFPYLRLLRAADSNAPMLSKVAGRKKQVEAQFGSWISGAVTTTGSGTVIDAALINELIQPIFAAKDHVSQSGPTCW